MATPGRPTSRSCSRWPRRAGSASRVPGGGYTQLVGERLPRTERREGRAASPAIVKERLVAPEVRIYGVGGRFIPFRVVSEPLDYRVDDATRVEPFPTGDVDPALLGALERLMERLGMESSTTWPADPSGRRRLPGAASARNVGGWDSSPSHRPLP